MKIERSKFYLKADILERFVSSFINGTKAPSGSEFVLILQTPGKIGFASNGCGTQEYAREMVFFLGIHICRQSKYGE